MDSSLRRALARARDGKALDVDEATVLMGARGEALAPLLEAAGRVRDAGLQAAGRPGVVTYSRKVFIPLTRLCRDRCHYCTFATTPGRVPAPYLSVDEVLDLARQGAALGCKEALFTLGDRPEDRWDAAQQWLDEAGYDSTLAYVRACAVAVLEETGLLPHLNPGVMSWPELQRLKPVAPSMGMMLETTADVPAHAGSPDKVPAVRLQVLEDAGRLSVPFTTGLLVGIGESLRDRAETVFAIRAAHRRHGHVQEVIVQNFRAKDDTAMRSAPDATLEEYLAAVAVTRLVMGPGMRVQAPPNLVDLEQTALLLRAGVDDWGGVSPLTPDHVNPERPWPQVEALARATERSGFVLRERLTAHPPYLSEPWLDPRLRPHVEALAGPDGLALDVRPVGLPWQEPDGGLVLQRAHRPARDRRHGRAFGRPALGLRRRVRRLGGRPRGGAGPRAAAARRRRRRAARRARRAVGAHVRAGARRSSPPTARTSTRSARSPTTCAATWSATRSRTS